MKKRLKFLKYILEENKDTMINQVYEELKKDSRKGDFVHLVKQDMKYLHINLSDEEIKKYSKRKWSELINKKTEEKGLEMLMVENKKKEKTKHIKFEKLEISEYLRQNKNTNVSKTIFQIRAGTFDVKAWRKWEYQDNLCVACADFEETFDHFMKCKNYKKENKYETNWKEIIQDSSKNKEKLIIAREAIERRNMRKKLLQVGLPQVAPKAP